VSDTESGGAKAVDVFAPKVIRASLLSEGIVIDYSHIPGGLPRAARVMALHISAALEQLLLEQGAPRTYYTKIIDETGHLFILASGVPAVTLQRAIQAAGYLHRSVVVVS